MNRRNRLWVGGAAALGAGVLLAGPLSAAAQDDGADWVTDALDDLVADGTITQQQADAVDAALDDARPERPAHPHRAHHLPGGGRFGIGLEAAAEAIGIEVDELRDALRDGQTIAEVAEANGVDVDEVIAAMTAAAEARLDDALADAEERRAELTERITDLVNEGFPQGGEDREQKAPTTDPEDEPAPTTTTGD